MKRNLLFFLFILLGLLTVSAQQQVTSPTSVSANGDAVPVPRTFSDEMVLPSPEAAGMNRYLDHPVDYSTGTARIQIPLLTLPHKDIPQSVTLSYHTGGIRVDDVPGVAGLGWTLHAGGSISRVIHNQPDEQKPFRQTDAATIGNAGDLDYLKDFVHLEVESNLDRYTYHFGKWSGSFLCNPLSGSITELPETDLSIRTSDGPDGVYNFVITTPDGTTYHFDCREHTDYRYSPVALDNDYCSPDYSAVSSWHLTKVVAPFRTDSLTLEYATVPTWSRVTTQNTVSTSFRTVNGLNTTYGSNMGELRSTHTTTFSDQRVLSRISGSTGSLEFSYSAISAPARLTTNPNIRLERIELKDPSGNSVRTVTLDNGSLFGDGRLRLDGLTVSSEGVTLDRRTFTYYDAASSTDKYRQDFFGYSNIRGQAGSSGMSVLDRQGNLSPGRLYHFESARAYALQSVTDATGAETVYEYEPNGYALSDTRYVNIGLRVRGITVSDPVTGRTRMRRLTYGSPTCTIDFSLLGSRHFIALSGVQTKDILIAQNTVGTTAAMTSTCRIPGFRAEDATVYYGKVTEEVSGDGLPHPVRTVYEYDTSSCRHTFCSVGKSWPVSLFGKEDVRMLGTFVPSDNLNPEVYAMRRKVFGGQPVGGYFCEEVRDVPVPLTRKTVFVCEDGAYRPLEEERHHYVTYNPHTVRTGMYVEGIARKCNKGLVVREDFQSVDDFDYFELTAHTARVFRDSTVYVRHYADGSTRRVSVGYQYNALLPMLTIPKAASFRVDTFTIDTILFHPDTYLPGFHSASVRPLYGSGLLGSATYACGPDTLTRYLCHSGNMRTPFYDSIRQSGCTSLPVMEKWVYNGQDSVLLENRHARFGRHMLPASKMLYWNGTEMERRDYLSYNRNGLPEEYSDNGLPHTFLVWGYGQQYLVGAFRNLTGEDIGASVLSKLRTYGMRPALSSELSDLLDGLSTYTGVLGTLYEHRPLVGVTRVTAPEGTSTAYGYTGGRLSSVTAPDGRVSEEYGYSLHCDSGANLVTTRHYLYGSQASRESAQYYDGFGLPWRLLEEDASPDGKDLLAQTLHDALYRRVEEWLPVPFSGDATETDFKGLSEAYYNDSRAFTSHTYEEAEDGRSVATAQPGEDLASHPVTTAYTCNGPADALLDCIRYSYDPSTGIQAHGSYPAGSLEVTVVTDGDGRKTYTFTDFLGRTGL